MHDVGMVVGIGLLFGVYGSDVVCFSVLAGLGSCGQSIGMSL